MKIGFSWPAFFLGLVWMLVKKLWGWAGACFAGYVVLSLVDKLTGQAGEDEASLLVALILVAGYVLLWLLPAFKGNKWLEADLKKRGYELVATEQADTPDAAVAQAVKAA